MKQSRITLTESQEQQLLFEWARLMEGRYPRLKWMFAIPNGGARHIATGKRLKAEGVKRGVPDIFLPGPDKSKCRHNLNHIKGLFLEMKRSDGGRMSPEQDEWGRALVELEYAHAVARGFEEAKDIILDYIGEKADQ